MNASRTRLERPAPSRVRRRLTALMMAALGLPALAGAAPVPYLVRDIDLTGKPFHSTRYPDCTLICPSDVYFGSLFDALTPLGNRVVFMATDHVHGLEPWVSDGTEAGTRMLADVRPGPDPDVLFGRPAPAFLGTAGAFAVFAADDGSGEKLYATDGTPAGTTQLTAPCSPDCSILDWSHATAELDGHLFFTAFSRVDQRALLYRTDGTSAGTRVAADFCPGYYGGFICGATVWEMVVWKGQLHYLVSEGPDLSSRLFRLTSPAATPIELLRTCHKRSLLPFGERLLFVGGCIGGPAGESLFVLDDAGAAPRLVRGFGHVDFPVRLVAWGGDRAAFLVGETLWTTDGTSAGTTQVSGLDSAWAVVAYRDLLLVSGKRDGQPGLFSLARDGALVRLSTGIFPPRAPRVVGGLAFFSNHTDAAGNEPWVSDGTPAGTRLLADVNSGPTSSVGDGNFVGAGGRVFFAADDGLHDMELWAAPLGAPPSLVRGPVDLQVQVGAPATFSVQASGDAPLAFQWLRNGAPIAGATAATYTLPAASPADDGASFSVVVSNGFGSVTSSPALLDVVPRPHGLAGTYFADPNLAVARLQRLDAQINFNWGNGAPAPALPANGFSARWTGEVEAPVTGSYTFHLRSDDGARLWVDDRLVVDDWGPHAARNGHGVLTLVGGRRYRLRLEYRDLTGAAVLRLLWTPPGMPRQVIPSAWLYPGG